MFFKKKDIAIKDYDDRMFYTPVSGEVIALSEVKDQAFSSGKLGQGVGIIPGEGKCHSPVNGTVQMIFPTGHAIGLVDDRGLEWILHIGIDTVNLQGEGFRVHVKEGDKITAGTLLLEFDLKLMRAKGIDTTVIFITTNPGAVFETVSYGMHECAAPFIRLG